MSEPQKELVEKDSTIDPINDEEMAEMVEELELNINAEKQVVKASNLEPREKRKNKQDGR